MRMILFSNAATFLISFAHSAGAGEKAGPLILKQHTKPVYAVAYSPDGKTLASSDDDGVIHLWDTATWKQRATMNMPAKIVRCLSWSGDSKMLLTGDKVKNAQLWDAETGKPLGEPFNQVRAVWAVAISKDGKKVATAGNGSPMRLWDVETRKELGVYQAREGFVNSLAFSPDGKLLMSAGGLAVVRIYHLDKIEGEGYVAMKGSKAAFSGDGTVLAGVHFSKNVIADDRKSIVSSHFTVIVRDMATGKDRCTFEAVKKGSNLSHAIAVNADGSLIAVAIDDILQFFDGKTGKRIAGRPGTTTYIYGLCFSPDGTKLVSGGDAVRVWDVPGK